MIDRALQTALKNKQSFAIPVGAGNARRRCASRNNPRFIKTVRRAVR